MSFFSSLSINLDSGKLATLSGAITPPVVCCCTCSSAAILPRVDEDSRVEHGVDVGAEWVLPLEVALVNWSWSVHTRTKIKVTNRHLDEGTYST